MKNILSLALFFGIFVFLYKKYWSRKPDSLDEHLTEQYNLQELGKIATNASILARPAISQFGDLPLSGRIITPFQNDGIGTTQFLPNGGWSYLLN